MIKKVTVMTGALFHPKNLSIDTASPKNTNAPIHRRTTGSWVFQPKTLSSTSNKLSSIFHPLIFQFKLFHGRVPIIKFASDQI